MTAHPATGSGPFLSRREMHQLRADLDAFRLGLLADVRIWQGRGLHREAGHALEVVGRVVKLVERLPG